MTGFTDWPRSRTNTSREGRSRRLRAALDVTRRTLNPDTTRELLDRLEADGLIRGDAELELTAEGEDRHHSLRYYIAGPTAELLGQLPGEENVVILVTFVPASVRS